jgi:hypothetical protein
VGSPNGESGWHSTAGSANYIDFRLWGTPVCLRIMCPRIMSSDYVFFLELSERSLVQERRRERTNTLPCANLF